MARTTRQKIERAAIKLISARGMDDVSMRDIAKSVGVTEAALYRHFASKHALVWEIFSMYYDQFAAQLNDLQAAENHIKDKIDVMVRAYCEFFDRDRDLFSFLLLTQHIQRIAPKNYEAAFSIMMQNLIQQAAVKKEIPAQNAQISTAMIMGCVLQSALYCLYQKPAAGKMMPMAGTLTSASWRIIQGA